MNLFNQPAHTSVDEVLTEIQASIAELKIKMDAKAPIGELVVRIHKDLYEKPQCFGLLTDTEISNVIQGIKIHTQRDLVVSKEKTRLKKNYSIDDLAL